MTPQEKQQLDNLERKLDRLLIMYQQNFFIDKVVFDKPVTFRDTFSVESNSFALGNSASTIGFYSATPVIQPATISDPSGGANIDSEARTAINTLIDRLQELGLIA